MGSHVKENQANHPKFNFPKWSIFRLTNGVKHINNIV